MQPHNPLPTVTVSELLSKITGAAGGGFDSAQAARQLLVAMLHRCAEPVWPRAFPAHRSGMPESIRSLHLESPGEASRLISPQLMGVLLESLVEPPFHIGLKDYHVSGPHPLSLLPISAAEPPVAQRMPIFAHFCADLLQNLNITQSAWFKLYVFTCSSYLHTDDVADARAALAVYLHTIRHGDKTDALLRWMREQDRILFGPDGSAEWQAQYVNEWKALAPYIRVALPHRYISRIAATEPEAAKPTPGAAAAPNPPQRMSPAAAAPALATVAKPPAKKAAEEEEGEGAGAKEDAPEVIDEQDLTPAVAKAEPAAAAAAPAAGEDDATSGGEEVQDGATKPAKSRLLPPIERIAHRCKRACCKRERIDHELLRDFVHSYGIDPSCRTDHAYRLALIRLFAPTPEVRAQLIGNYFLHPQNIIDRLDHRGPACKLEKHHWRQSGADWHGFMSVFNAVDTSDHSALPLLHVDSLNDAINRAAVTGESATATSVRIQRFLTIHYGGPQHWRRLWTHGWGAPSPGVVRVVNSYLARQPHVHPCTLQRITYLVPAPIVVD